MTVQFENKIRYEGESFSIICRENAWPFEPETYGIKTQATCTACWRGYVCDYAIVDKCLILDNLEINSDSTESISINGVLPNNKDPHFLFNWSYKNLALPIRYSGGLVLGNNLICRDNIRMEYHRTLCYETVLEFIFDEGKIIKIIDQSKKLMKYHICMESALREYVHNARKLILAVFGADAKYDISDMPPIFSREYPEDQFWT